MTYSRLVHRAMDFAARAHAKQARKKSETPFVSHSAMVGFLLHGAGMDETIVAAGLLHDVVEDTEIGFAAVEEAFGREVADLVRHVTERDKSKPWQERKTLYIEHLKEAPEAALAVAAADKIHNIHSIILYGEGSGDPWSISKGNKEQQLWYYRTIGEVLRGRFGPDPAPGATRLLEDFEAALDLLEKAF